MLSQGQVTWQHLAVKRHQMVATMGVCSPWYVSVMWMPPWCHRIVPHCGWQWDLVVFGGKCGTGCHHEWVGVCHHGWMFTHVRVPVGRCHPHTVPIADGSGEDGSGVLRPPTVMTPAPSSGLAPTGKGTLWMALGPRLVPDGTALNFCLLFILLLFLFLLLPGGSTWAPPRACGHGGG